MDGLGRKREFVVYSNREDRSPAVMFRPNTTCHGVKGIRVVNKYHVMERATGWVPASGPSCLPKSASIRDESISKRKEQWSLGPY